MSDEGTTGAGANREKLSEALETVIEVLGANRLEALHGRMDEVDSRLSGRIGTLSEEAKTASERVMNELSGRIDEALGKLDELSGKLDGVSERLQELDSRQKSALDYLEQHTQESSADLTRRIEKSESAVEDRIRALKEELGGSLASKEEQINKDLESLAKGLSGIQLEFQQHSRSTERMSALLNGMATVLSEGPPSPARPRDDATANEAAPPEAENVEPGGVKNANDENLDNALDRVFSWDPSQP